MDISNPIKPSRVVSSLAAWQHSFHWAGCHANSPVPVNSGTRTTPTTTTASRTSQVPPPVPTPTRSEQSAGPAQPESHHERNDQPPAYQGPRPCAARRDRDDAYPRSPTAAPAPALRPPSPLVWVGSQREARERNETEARRTVPQPAHATTSSTSFSPTTTTTSTTKFALRRAAPRLAPPRRAARPVSLGNPPTQPIASPPRTRVRAWRRLALPPPSPPPRSPGAPISRRVARDEEEVGGREDGDVRVAAQRVRGQAPHAAVRRRQRPLGRRGRGAAEAQPPRREGAEDGAIARRVDGNHPGGRRVRRAVRRPRYRRRSPDVQQPRVPRWVGGWTDGVLSPLPPVRLPPAACFGVWSRFWSPGDHGREIARSSG